MKTFTRKITDFNIGMNPNIYGDGIVRMEHFDTVTKQARPYNTLAAGTITGAYEKIVAFASNVSTIYALAKLTASETPIILSWDNSAHLWVSYQSLEVTGVRAFILHRYKGYFWGLRSGTHIWRMTSGSTSEAFQPLTYTNYAQPITHSKDELMYFATDNKVTSFNGTTISASPLTLPTNFLITSMAENGDYINIVGYDTATGKATMYKWDRDSSLATLTAKYEIGRDVPYHVVSLNGTVFVVSLAGYSTNTQISDEVKLIIRYVEGDKLKVLKQFRFVEAHIGGSYVQADKIYFNLNGRMVGDSASHAVIAELDESGNIVFSQNVGINDAGNNVELPSIYREGDGFWIAGNGDGNWNTSTGFTTVSKIETVKYSATEANKSLDFVGAVVKFEPLPASATVTLSTRANESATWVSLAVFSTDNSLKGVVTKQSASTTPAIAKERQFKIESYGGAVITGFQCDMVEVSDEAYG